MLRSQRHVGGAEQRVRTGSEHIDAVLACSKGNFGTVRASDPVALHGLDLVRPIQVLEVVDQAIGVRGDAHHPLLEMLTEDWEVSAVTTTVGGDFLVGQDGTQTGAPVDHRIRLVDKAVRVQNLGLRGHVQRSPLASVFQSALTGIELGFQLGDTTRLAGFLVVPGAMDLQEDPLRPVVEVDIRRRETTTLVVAQTQASQLALHVGDVGLGGGPWVGTRLHGVLLGRETEGVVTEGVQDIAALHAMEAREDVRSDVSERVTDVQTRTRGVREHVLNKELVGGNTVGRGERTDRIGRVERAFLTPAVLPVLLDLAGELRGVAVLRSCVGW